MRTAIRGVARGLAGQLLRRAEAAYLAGRTLDESLAVIRRLRDRGFEVVLGYWHTEEEAPAAVLQEYLAAVAALRRSDGAGQLAVKAPALGMDPGAVTTLARAAAAARVGLAFDAHGPDLAEETLRVAGAAAAEGAPTTVALPSRWARSPGDARTVATAGMAARIVKGQWADDGASSRLSEAHLRAQFLRLLDEFVDDPVAVMVATHDPVLLDEALQRLGAAGIPCEAQFMLGLPARRVLAVAARHAVPVRFYVAYGHPSLVYSPRSALERPRLAFTLGQGALLGSANQWLRRRELAAAPRPRRSAGPAQ